MGFSKTGISGRHVSDGFDVGRPVINDIPPFTSIQSDSNPVFLDPEYAVLNFSDFNNSPMSVRDIPGEPLPSTTFLELYWENFKDAFSSTRKHRESVQSGGAVLGDVAVNAGGAVAAATGGALEPIVAPVSELVKPIVGSAKTFAVLATVVVVVGGAVFLTAKFKK